MKPFDIIAFDADDTLWHNETLFLTIQERFKALLTPYHSADWIAERLYQTEIRNLSLFGYGVKGFVLSMIETAIELTEGRITGNEIQTIIEFAREMLTSDIELLAGVEQTVDALAECYRLMIITKGDLFDQETKIARSGLGDYFRHVEIVSEKTPDIYRMLLSKYEVAPERFLMVGNSLRSDVLPVVAAGARAVHIPYQTTWAHEVVSDKEAAQANYYELDHIRKLPDLLEKLSGGR